MIKKFNLFEKHEDIDPYGEENWDWEYNIGDTLKCIKDVYTINGKIILYKSNSNYQIIDRNDGLYSGEYLKIKSETGSEHSFQLKDINRWFLKESKEYSNDELIGRIAVLKNKDKALRREYVIIDTCNEIGWAFKIANVFVENGIIYISQLSHTSNKKDHSLWYKLDNFEIKEDPKRIFSEDDPYGEEIWESVKSKYNLKVGDKIVYYYDGERR